MCSNAEEEQDGALLMEKVEKINLTDKHCRKCETQNKADVVLRGKDAYCKLCFLTSVNHKFRACLGKSKIMRPGDKVLIGFSGNHNSSSLLHLINSGLKDSSHKRLMFVPHIAFIDESSVLGMSTEEQQVVLENINVVLERFEYPKYILPLALSIMPEEAVESYLAGTSTSTDESTLVDLVSALKDVTSKTDLLHKLRHNLLLRIARSLGCLKVFTAESADDLAVKLLTNVSLGRGAQLPHDVGFSDDRVSGIKVLRPLRDLSKKELVYYNVFHELPSVHVPSLTTKIDTHSSIHKLTESFLNDLQDGFQSTYSTVFRVADKLTTTPGKKETCPLCQALIDTEHKTSSSLSDTQFSILLSSVGPDNFDTKTLEENSTSTCDGNTECRSRGGGCCSDSNNGFKHLLCYGCNLIFRNAKLDSLPKVAIKHLQEASQRFKMKTEIEEFLL